jgi:HD superfamily phosphohydrolase
MSFVRSSGEFLPELDAFGPSVRLPELTDVRLTPRFRALLDQPAVQRLRRVRQLGPTFLVYPGAVHTRFEHSLGAFGVMQRALLSLLRDPVFRDGVTEADLLAGLAAALLHDVGHYPFAHSLEALHRRGGDTPRHEHLTAQLVTGPLGAVIERELGVDPARVARLVGTHHTGQPTDVDAILASALSSGLDVDKIDYLGRDSTHLGVPYGRGFDAVRLLGALCVSPSGRRVAVSARGKISAEAFVFGRYMMFSEVYWHHTVRAVSAMVEHALHHAFRAAPLDPEFVTPFLLSASDDTFLDWIYSRLSGEHPGSQLIGALHGGGRRLHKRLITFSRAYAEADKRAAFERLYSAPAALLAAIHEDVRSALETVARRPVRPDDVLIDTPPRDKDHPEPIEVVFGDVRGQRSYDLSALSHVVQGVSTDFVVVVKKVRIFVAAELAERLSVGRHAVEEAVVTAILEATAP